MEKHYLAILLAVVLFPHKKHLLVAGIQKKVLPLATLRFIFQSQSKHFSEMQCLFSTFAKRKRMGLRHFQERGGKKGDKSLVRILAWHFRKSQAQIQFHCQLGQSLSVRTMQESGKGIEQKHSFRCASDTRGREIHNQKPLIQSKDK